MLLYLVGGLAVFVGSGVMAMAGLGAAFLFVPLFYYLGVPLPEATSTALLLNAVSLSAATVAYARGGLVDWRAGIPVLIAAVILAPVGASLTARVDRTMLLALFVGFLVFAGAIMLFYTARTGRRDRGGAAEAAVGAAVGTGAGFLGGLLGVGGGNIILPALTWLGLDPKVAAGTTALAVVFSSLSGFLGHAALGGLDPLFLVTMALLAAGGSLAGSHLMRTRLTGPQLKRIIGVLLFVIAAKIALDLLPCARIGAHGRTPVAPCTTRLFHDEGNLDGHHRWRRSLRDPTARPPAWLPPRLVWRRHGHGDRGHRRVPGPGANRRPG